MSHFSSSSLCVAPSMASYIRMTPSSTTAQYGKGGRCRAEDSSEASGFFGDLNTPGEIVAGAECGAHRCEARFVALRVTRLKYGRGSVLEVKGQTRQEQLETATEKIETPQVLRS